MGGYTAVMSQRGMSAALGMGKLGGRVPRLVERGAEWVGPELAEKLSKPVFFLWQGAVPNQPIHGYDVTLLIDLCKAIIAANAAGKLRKSQQALVNQAHVIVGASRHP